MSNEQPAQQQQRQFRGIPDRARKATIPSRNLTKILEEREKQAQEARQRLHRRQRQG